MKIALDRFLVARQRTRETHGDTFTSISTLNEWRGLPGQTVLIQVDRRPRNMYVTTKAELPIPNFDEFEYYLKDESMGSENE